MSGNNQHDPRGQKRTRSGDDDLGSALLPQQGTSPLAELELFLRLHQSSNRLQAPQPPSGQRPCPQLQIQNLQGQLQFQQVQQSQVQPQPQLSTAGVSLGQVNAPIAAANQQSQQQADLLSVLASLGLGTGGNSVVPAGNPTLLNLGLQGGFVQPQPPQQVSQPQAQLAPDNILQQLAQLQQNQAPVPAPRPQGRSLAGLCLPIGNTSPSPSPLPASNASLRQTLQPSNLNGNLASLLLLAQAQGNQAQAAQAQPNQQPSGGLLELLRQHMDRPDPPTEVNANLGDLQALLQNALGSGAPAAVLPTLPPNAASVPSAAAVQPSEPSAKRPKHNQSHLVDNSNTKSVLLYFPTDDDSLSPYQAYARQQVELFEAQEVDVSTGAQGRNKPVKVGQVGIRCIHCKDLHPKLRTRASVYYPSRLTVLYQAAQNIVNVHLPELCESIPSHVRARLLSLDNKRSSVGGGKNYWSDTAKTQGVVDTDEGLRFFSSL